MSIWEGIDHTRSSNSSIARVHREQSINTQRSILVVGFDRLGDLPLVTLVGSRAVIRECFGASEFMVGRRGCDDVALRCDLSGETGDGAGD